MSNQEIEKYLQEILKSDQLVPSVRDLARKFNIHNWQFMRDHREITSLIIKKRKTQLKKIMNDKNKVVVPIVDLRQCLRCPKTFSPRSKFNKLCPDCNLYIKYNE